MGYVGVSKKTVHESSINHESNRNAGKKLSMWKKEASRQCPMISRLARHRVGCCRRDDYRLAGRIHSSGMDFASSRDVVGSIAAFAADLANAWFEDAADGTGRLLVRSRTLAACCCTTASDASAERG